MEVEEWDGKENLVDPAILRTSVNVLSVWVERERVVGEKTLETVTSARRSDPFRGGSHNSKTNGRNGKDLDRRAVVLASGGL